MAPDESNPPLPVGDSYRAQPNPEKTSTENVRGPELVCLLNR